MVNRLILVVISMFLTIGNQALGEEQSDDSLVFVAPEDMDEGAVMASTTRGVVESINLEDRTAQISGYTYDFGDPNDPLPVKVTMLNSAFGAFELLLPNMKVEIVYGETEEIRLAVTLQQLADDAEMEIH